ncbi:MAG: CBS domain-containing protein [Micromonosporaceae bacterium]|nr:CBS domain-containing protein [Micromonosporaceae bacterium]
MRARDLSTPFPTVTAATAALEAARLLARRALPGLIVVDDAGSPVAVLAGPQVLRLAVPAYVVEDPNLAGVVDEVAADEIVRNLDGRTVRDCLQTDHPRQLPVVDQDATVLEMAALMARSGTPLVAVTDEDGRVVGAVTLDALLERAVAR